MSEQAIIIAARRSPIGKIGGIFQSLKAEQLAAFVFRALLDDLHLPADEIDDVVMGNAVGPGGNIARLAALMAGLPVTVPGFTVDRQCGSGLEAIHLAARLIESGAGHVYLAGGVESTSTAPWKIERNTDGQSLPRFISRARFSPETIGDPDMGVAAENVARAYGISRERQDAYALQSQIKAVASIGSRRFEGEIVAIKLSDGTIASIDECPRANTSLEKLAALKPAFVDNGTVTAGNACPVNDGAAAVVVVSSSWYRKHGLSGGLRIVDSTSAGVDPNLLGIGPVPAVTKVMQRQQQLRLADIEIVEFNEAFAAQVLASLDALGLDQCKVNIGGGALALGHPYGASGAILITRLFAEMVGYGPSHSTALEYGLATLGIGGGLGLATLLQRV